LFAGTGNGYVGFNDLWRYSLTTNTWTQDTYVGLSAGDANLLLRQYHASAIIGNKFYVYGGYSYADFVSSSDLWEYNLNTKVWTNLVADGTAGSPTGRQGHSLNVYDDPVLGNSLIVFGGYPVSPQEQAFNDAWQYVISTGEWIELSTGAGGPAGRYAHTSELIGSNLFIYAGLNTIYSSGGGSTDVYYADTWSLQLAGNGETSWVQELPNTATGPAARQGHQAALVNNVFYISGGYIQYVGLQDDVWSLKSSS